MRRPSESEPRVFLTAEWRWLAMLNYAVEPELLAPYLPAGVELDFWNGRPYVSVVGFLWRHARLLGLSIPWHRNFAEVNLRFYVRRRDERNEPGTSVPGLRTGVCFIREIVPRRAVALVANAIYNEHFSVFPMRHRIEPSAVEYAWRLNGEWQRLRIAGANVDAASRRVESGETPLPHVGKSSVAPLLPSAGSMEDFIVNRTWGYSRQRDGGCLEYKVEHRPWRVWQAASAELTCDSGRLYGPAFATVLSRPPDSAFLVDGSAVTVRRRVPIVNEPGTSVPGMRNKRSQIRGLTSPAR